jgi:hypothetical protein
VSSFYTCIHHGNKSLETDKKRKQIGTVFLGKAQHTLKNNILVDSSSKDL